MPCTSSAAKIGHPDFPVLIPSSLFNEARLKVYRAKRHAHEISVSWESYIEADHEMLGVQFQGSAGRYGMSNIPIPADIPLAMGDCLHSLRSALDYLVAALAREASLPDDHVQFPFNKERKLIEATFEPEGAREGQKRGKRSGALYSLFVAYQDLKGIILDDIKPYSADDGGSYLGDLLWRLITMDNIDKHRLITPIAQSTSIKLAQIGGITFKDCTFGGFNASNPGIVFKTSEKPEFQENSNFALDIFFPNTTRLPGKPVLSSLIEGANLVAGVVEIFEAHFQRKNPGN